MKDCSNYNTQVASNLMDVLMVDFKPTPNDVSNRQLFARGLSPWGVGLNWRLGVGFGVGLGPGG